MKIKVTQDHIDAAEFLRDQRWREGGDSGPLSIVRTCPIAIALSCAGLNVNSVSSTLASIDGMPIPLPPKATTAINYFDNKRQVRPFTFELNF